MRQYATIGKTQRCQRPGWGIRAVCALVPRVAFHGTENLLRRFSLDRQADLDIGAIVHVLGIPVQRLDRGSREAPGDAVEESDVRTHLVVAASVADRYGVER
ncbi:MAG: hypothetical protein PF508_00085 [Spirochaeta sp.]|nr:hypothetical protein [Spirochaeta sp.]